MIFNEYDIVRATVDVQRQDCTIKKGDEGTIVHVYKDETHEVEAYEVEFIREDTSDVVLMYSDELETI